MLRAYKTEIEPNDEQKTKIHQTIGVCRFVYNFYLSENQKSYEQNKVDNKFINANDFSKWLNNEFIPKNPEYSWIKDVSSKSVKKSLVNAENAYIRFFKGLSKFPKFKKKKHNDVKIYFVKTDKKSLIKCDRHRIKIPCLGWIKLKEYGYIPTNEMISSGSVSYKAGRYYVSVIIKTNDIIEPKILKSEGLGIDLGIENFAICSNGKVYKNINKTEKILKLEKKLRREQRKLSRKYESFKNNKKEGEATTRQNINKQILKVQKVHQKLTNIRSNYQNQVVNEIVKIKPFYITIENLNVKGMMKNKYLSHAIARQGFYSFIKRLIYKAHENKIEVRIVDRFYPSSKKCSCCGNFNSELKLSDRVFVCKTCNLAIDRDINAAINLREAKLYKVA